jgi:galactose mutarotase-like enzyme
LEYIIENENFRISVDDQGAELKSISSKKHHIEYLWQGNPDFWGRRAPILFPIVGKLKDNTYKYNNHDYHLSQHGFARDMVFEMVSQEETKLSFLLKSTEATRVDYPFEWTLGVSYQIDDNKLSVSVEINNTSSTNDMWFSVGFHPAFNVPIEHKTNKQQTFALVFNKDITANKRLLDNGLLSNSFDIGLANGRIPLDKNTFLKDALVFQDLKTNEITLHSENSERGLIFSFDGFPYLGIWSKPDAPFVCIEPWHGIADTTVHDGNLIHKEGIKSLKSKETFSCGYSVKVF